MTINVTLNDIRRTVEEIVSSVNDSYCYADVPANKGDGDCFYVHHTEDGENVPGCLVGQMWTKMGIPLGYMLDHNDSSSSTLFGNLLRDRVVTLEEAYTGATTTYLTTLQSSQDFGHTWRRSLDEANAAYDAYINEYQED